MEFNSGMLGVAIVVLGLIASCLFGVVMNVNQETYMEDTDHFVTDITGLYSTSAKDKAYTQYAPAKNYNGYSSDNDTTFPVEFTPSGTGNNYPFSYDDASNHSRIIDVTTYNVTGSGIVGNVYWSSRGPINVTAPSTGVDYRFTAQGWKATYSYVNLATIINIEKQYAEQNYANVEKITLNIPFTIYATPAVLSYEYDVYGGLHYSCSFAYSYSTNSMIMIALDDLSRFESGALSSPYTQMYISDLSHNSDYTGVITCEYNISNGLCIFYYGGELYESSYNISDYILAYPTTYIRALEYETLNSHSSYGTVVDKEERPSTNQFYVGYESSKTTGYLDPRYGVSVRDTENVIWSNDYENGAMDLTVYLGTVTRGMSGSGYTIYGIDSEYDTEKEIIWQFNHESAPSDILRFHHSANGENQLQIKYYDNRDTSNPQYGNYATINLGKDWIAYNIQIDFTKGKIYVQAIPPSTWNSFTDWTSDQPISDVGEFKRVSRVIKTENGEPVYENGNPVYEDLWETVYEPATSIKITSPLIGISHSVAMQISNTSVFLNTYGVIMIDPHVDIVDWYPNTLHFKMKFTDIASIGSSISLNGVVYPITNGEITINDTQISLSKFEIEFRKGEENDYQITITSLANNKSTDIYNATDTNISMEGAWYFTSGYYTVLPEEVHRYIWDVSEGIGYGYTGVILFMMIFMGVITIAWWKIQPGALTFFDIAIIIGVEILLFMLLG